MDQFSPCKSVNKAAVSTIVNTLLVLYQNSFGKVAANRQALGRSWILQTVAKSLPKSKFTVLNLNVTLGRWICLCTYAALFTLSKPSYDVVCTLFIHIADMDS